MNSDLFNIIKKEYEINDDIFNEEDEMVIYIKKALNLIQPADKIIMLLYSELQSLRKVGKQLGVSHTIVYREIKRIRKEIIEIIAKLQKNDLSKLTNN